MNTSPLLTPSNLADFGPVGPKFLRTLNTKKCSPFRALVMPVRQNGIDKEIYEGRASRTREVWTRPGKSTFYVRNHDGQFFTLYRTEAALNDDNDNPDIIELTEFTWQILENIDVDKLTDPAVMKRVVHMDGTEVAARLKSFAFTSNGDMTFGRGEGTGIRSHEKTRMVQAGNGDFGVEVTTGDGSE